MGNDILYWLATARLDGISSRRIHRCLEHFGNIKNFFSASIKDLQDAGLKPEQIQILQNCDWKRIEKDLMWCEQENCQIVTYADEQYPVLLRELKDAPLLLFVRGDVTLLSQPQFAIVGSRNPTVRGKEDAELFAHSLAQAGLVITSGLASGIDAASHFGALSANGKTIAVCGTGLTHIYPYSNRKLAEEIMAKGAVISEYPPGVSAKAKNFPMRNRIISGMSLGVLVVEAALHSGSLITARLAADQGREVFALPGSIHNPLARGCHQLIRLGAKLVETSEDILEELGAIRGVLKAIPRKLQAAKLDKNQKKVLAQIGFEITALDTIISRSELPASEVSAVLLSLELEGYAKAASGGYIRC